MSTPFYYETNVRWVGEKRGVLQSAALPRVEVAAPPEFNGHEGSWSPEHLFTSAVSSCFMTTFLAIAEMSKLDFASFSADAIGKLEKLDGHGYMMTEVIIRPRLRILRERDRERAARILEKAERNCLISNSVKSAIKLEPVIEVSGENDEVAAG
jgi:peroxiredoxin-like protein